MKIDQKTQLLGDLTPSEFMRTHWQKKPLLVRGAVSAQTLTKLPDGTTLQELGAREDVPCRLISSSKGAWELKHGPFTSRQIPTPNKPDWTLLVQGVDLIDAAAHDLLEQFRFVPDARLDDAMFSLAGVGGGVGPHFDSYDVFLIQTSGRRRWRLSVQKDLSLQPEMPLKMLQNFKHTKEYVLEAGDMLYLPPKYAHDGVALAGDDNEPCITCSIGFRAPKATELAQTLMDRLSEDLDEIFDADNLYADADQAATATPAKIPEALQTYAWRALQQVMSQKQALALHLGEYLSEPKPDVWFESPLTKLDRKKVGSVGIRLAAATRMVYDEKRIFINGESFDASGADAKLMRALADTRRLETAAFAKASADARNLLLDWVDAGWVLCQ